jgi:predicted DNA-binding transcriptional regulator AlpA
LREKSLKEYNDKINKDFMNKYNNFVEAAKTLQIGKSAIYRMLKRK